MGRNIELIDDDPVLLVALYARAWVEIGVLTWLGEDTQVALYARAWVEIKNGRNQIKGMCVSPSTRGRG